MTTSSRVVSAEDMKGAARRRLPKMVFDFLEGGVLDEITVARNTADLRAVEFKQRTLAELEDSHTAVSMLGRQSDIPFFVSPMGMLGMMHPHADVGVARAITRAGGTFIHSAWSGVTLDEVVAAAEPGRVWGQVNYWKNREHTERHLENLRKHAIDVLVLPGDCVFGDKRERDLHHGLNNLPPRLSIPDMISCALRPAWVANILFGRKVTYGNYTINGRPLKMSQMKPWMAENEDVTVSWRDLAKTRENWQGKIVLKGVMCAEDAKRALDLGVDAIFVSNHGGRQFDRQPSTVSVIEEVVEAVDGRAEVYADGGVARGHDALAMMSAGATAVGLGRSVAYALAAGGEAAVSKLIAQLTAEFEQAMGFCGVSDPALAGPEIRRNSWGGGAR
ncbi:L-lactate dehydrogenase (cytochrome) [Mycolicibacterium mucogenicum 261Sha1.1M5]|nr:L-lactate dehydrogenase (cytochrome) [Mycolicibacterium mucogenicum 261Sha1.1M5]